MKYIQLLVAVFLMLLTKTGSCETLSLDKLAFDSSKYIAVDELERGMIGYGLTVFEGSKVEKFKVKLVSIMPSKSSGRSAFLIKVIDNEIFDIARGVQGCSGSPVFFDDRMAGAMAFGWGFQKEPLYGVTPIRHMLDSHKLVLANDKKTVAGSKKILDDQVYQKLFMPQILSENDLASIARAAGLASSGKSDGMSTLSPMVSFSGFNNVASEHFGQVLPGFNASVGNFAADVELLVKQDRPKIERGSSIVIPILSGDYNGAVLGTVTEVIDDWVFAFGHAFNGNGKCNWPMATGYIHTFMSSTNMSFKLGQSVDTVGAVEADEISAICGRIGKKVETCKAHTLIHYDNIDESVDFNMELVRDQMFISSIAMTSVVGPTVYRGSLPDLCTIEYDVNLDFGEFGTLTLSDISSDSSTFELALDIVQNCGLVINSPWDEAMLDNIDAKVRINDQTSSAQFDTINLDKTVYYPGDTIKANIKCFQYRLPEIELNTELKLPDDIEPGEYDLNISDKRKYLLNISRLQPFRGYADSTEKILSVLNQRSKYRQDCIYMYLALNKPGLAVEDEPMPDLPAGKAMLLKSNARQVELSPLQEVIESIKPCEYVIKGAYMAKIQVREK